MFCFESTITPIPSVPRHLAHHGEDRSGLSEWVGLAEEMESACDYGDRVSYEFVLTAAVMIYEDACINENSSHDPQDCRRRSGRSAKPWSGQFANHGILARFGSCLERQPEAILLRRMSWLTPRIS